MFLEFRKLSLALIPRTHCTPRTVPSGSVNGHFLFRTVPLWKGNVFDSRTVPELFYVGVNAIFPRTVPVHA